MYLCVMFAVYTWNHEYPTSRACIEILKLLLRNRCAAELCIVFEGSLSKCLIWINVLMSVSFLSIGGLLLHLWAEALSGPSAANVDDRRFMAKSSHPQCSERHPWWPWWALWHHSTLQESLSETCLPVHQNDGVSIHTVRFLGFFFFWWFACIFVFAERSSKSKKKNQVQTTKQQFLMTYNILIWWNTGSCNSLEAN